MTHELMTEEVRREADRTSPRPLIYRLWISLALTFLDGVAIWQWFYTDVLSSLDGTETAISGVFFLVMLGTLAHVWSVTLSPVLRQRRRG